MDVWVTLAADAAQNGGRLCAVSDSDEFFRKLAMKADLVIVGLTSRRVRRHAARDEMLVVAGIGDLRAGALYSRSFR
jgi:hypothetical protein